MSTASRTRVAGSGIHGAAFGFVGIRCGGVRRSLRAVAQRRKQRGHAGVTVRVRVMVMVRVRVRIGVRFRSGFAVGSGFGGRKTGIEDWRMNRLMKISQNALTDEDFSYSYEFINQSIRGEQNTRTK